MVEISSRIPEVFTQTVNLTGGSVKILEAIPSEYEVSYLEISNESLLAQLVYVGYGQPATAGMNPTGPGFSRTESIDARSSPFQGQVFVLASADGAVISVQRRIQKRTI